MNENELQQEQLLSSPLNSSPVFLGREVLNLPQLLSEQIEITQASLTLEEAKEYAFDELWDDTLSNRENAERVTEYLEPFRVAAGFTERLSK